MNITLDFLNIILYSMCISSISIFLDNSMEQGMIFNFWKKFIQTKWYFQYKIKDGKYTSQAKKNITLQTLYKITGGCIYCTNFYLSLPFWFLFFGLNTFVLFAFFIIHLGLNNVFISIYDQLTLYFTKNKESNDLLMKQMLTTANRNNMVNYSNNNIPNNPNITYPMQVKLTATDTPNF